MDCCSLSRLHAGNTYLLTHLLRCFPPSGGAARLSPPPSAVRAGDFAVWRRCARAGHPRGDIEELEAEPWTRRIQRLNTC